MMICHACLTAFPFEDLPVKLPLTCPYCGKQHINVKAMFEGKDRMVSIPAVRQATEDETTIFNYTANEVRADEAFAEKITEFGGIKLFDLETDEDASEPDTYGMSIEEHNMALMMMYVLRNSPIWSTQDSLERLLRKPETTVSEEAWIKDKTEQYTWNRRQFRSEVTAAKSELEKKGEFPSRLNNVDWDSMPLALKAFFSFQRKKDGLYFLNELPNNGNITSVKPKEIAENPSEGFINFLMDWYNSIGNEE